MWQLAGIHESHRLDILGIIVILFHNTFFYVQLLGRSSNLFWRRQKSRFSVLDSITQHVAGKDFAVFSPEHVLQHLPGQEIAIILTGHVLRLRLEHGLGLFGARVPEFTGFVQSESVCYVWFSLAHVH